MRWPQVKQGPLRTTRTLVPSIHLSGKFSSRIFRTKHLPVLSNCGVSVGEIIEHVIKYQVNRTERNRSLSLPRQGFDVKHAERKITVTSLLLSSFWALQLCAPDHTLISAPTRLGFYWCHLQWVRNFLCLVYTVVVHKNWLIKVMLQNMMHGTYYYSLLHNVKNSCRVC